MERNYYYCYYYSYYYYYHSLPVFLLVLVAYVMQNSTPHFTMIFRKNLAPAFHFSNYLPCRSLEILRCFVNYYMVILLVFSNKAMWETESLPSLHPPTCLSWKPERITKIALSSWHAFHSYLINLSSFWHNLVLLIHQRSGAVLIFLFPV